MFLRRRGVAVLNTSLRKQTHLIQQLDRIRLTPQHSIHVLQIEDRNLVIAVHNQGITLLEQSSGRSNCVRPGGALTQ